MFGEIAAIAAPNGFDKVRPVTKADRVPRGFEGDGRGRPVDDPKTAKTTAADGRIATREKAPVQSKNDSADSTHGRRTDFDASVDDRPEVKVKFQARSPDDPGAPLFEAEGQPAVRAKTPRVESVRQQSGATEVPRVYDAQGREAEDDPVGQKVDLLV